MQLKIENLKDKNHSDPQSSIRNYLFFLRPAFPALSHAHGAIEGSKRCASKGLKLEPGTVNTSRRLAYPSVNALDFLLRSVFPALSLAKGNWLRHFVGFHPDTPIPRYPDTDLPLLFPSSPLPLFRFTPSPPPALSPRLRVKRLFT